MNKLILTLLSAGLVALSIAPMDSEAKIVEEERSLYQNVYIVKEVGLTCMRFRKKSHNDLSQSCIYDEKPKDLVFDYYKLAMGATFFLDDPKDMLVIGLGGGVLVNRYKEVYPNANIVSVEIDEVVAEMAKKYFDYTDDSEQYETHVRDGRVFVKRALRKDRRFDFILLDAFNSDYIPEHMMTKEYLEEVKGLLKPGGIIMANSTTNRKPIIKYLVTCTRSTLKTKRLTALSWSAMKHCQRKKTCYKKQTIINPYSRSTASIR